MSTLIVLAVFSMLLCCRSCHSIVYMCVFVVCVQCCASVFVRFLFSHLSSFHAYRWDDPFGPLILTFLLILAMLVQFYFKV